MNDTFDPAKARENAGLMLRDQGCYYDLAAELLLAAADEVERLRAENAELVANHSARDETETALYETTCQVAEALGLEVWGNDELGPAVEQLRTANAMLVEHGHKSAEVIAMQASDLALVHSRLDAMGVPACEEEPCQECNGIGYTRDKPPCTQPNDCTACNGTGKRPVECRIAARLDWVAKRQERYGRLEERMERDGY